MNKMSTAMEALFTEACKSNYDVGNKSTRLTGERQRAEHYDATTRAAKAEKALYEAIEKLEADAELGQLIRRMPEIVKWPLTNQCALAYRQHMTEEFWHVMITPNEDVMLKAALCKETPEEALKVVLSA